jgi:hypothetical protein
MAIRETELYLPVKQYLEKLGFAVRSEVRYCDLTAMKDDHLLIVELKTSFNLELVLQGVERKRICDDVYLAIPRPRNMRTKRWRKILRLCKALGLGLLTVSLGGTVEALCNPLIQPPRKSPGPKGLLLREINGRSGDYNTGGSTGRPLVTAYREQALKVAQCVSSGLQRPRDIAAATGDAKAGMVLQKNYYGWFERVERGIYCLSPSGQKALSLYADLLE